MTHFDPPYHGMDEQRWKDLFDYSVGKRDDLLLTDSEIADGWHFCWGWDGMLLNRHHDHDEMKSCPCFEPNPNIDV